MKLKLFDVVPENFFSVLSSQNKHIYADCIFLIYKSTNELSSYGIERELLIDVLVDYLDQLGEESISIFDEDEENTGRSSRDRANGLIRKFAECGWIDIEENSNYVETINLVDYAIAFIETMDKLMKNDRLEYQGYVYTIYTLLFSHESVQPSVMLEQVYENTKKLISGLKTLNSNIKKYTDQITKLKSAEDILSLQFNDYETNIIDKGYHRLKTSDNVSKFRPKIIEKLEELNRDADLIKQVSEQLVEMEKAESIEQAYNSVRNSLNDTIYAINHIDEIIKEIDRKNSQYLKASLTRVKYVLNSSKDLEGQLTEILKYIATTYKDKNLDLNNDYLDEIIGIIGVYPQSFIDEQSLYVSNEGRRSFKPQSLAAKTISVKERKERLDRFKEKNRQRLSKTTINKYVLGLLGGRQVMNASQIPIDTFEDFIKVIYIRVYAKSNLVQYKVKKLGTEVKINDFKFNDFEIWKQ
ncbi:Wadjet anti-phage system protein JetA family protein [Haloplasma contractile]|uniref:Uncharacterized protein n=1 Tax=Haloplasma contractile SSD-17B TaxID=1033810 RepID=F7PTT5_9MOLU|nr:Wadjet anti-phage system protein JetA family protein [Haloplasma contractile]ERJ12248.1 hypothetical protein HLPCO_001775 [Haloplasma contractile SSD-17B]